MMACGVLYSLKFKFGQLLIDDRRPVTPVLLFNPCLGLFIHVQLQLSRSLFPPRASEPGQP